MAATAGLFQNQLDDLAQVAVGDFLLISVSQTKTENNEPNNDGEHSGSSESDDNENNSEDGAESDHGDDSETGHEMVHELDDSDNDSESENAAQSSHESNDDNDDNDDHDDEDHEQSYYDNYTPPIVSLYKVLGITSAEEGIADLIVGLMQHVLKPSERTTDDYFHLYGATIIHHAAFPDDLTENLTDILRNGSCTVMHPANGDTIFTHKFRYACPAGCIDGWLPTQKQMHELMTGNIQVISEYRPVCPVCIGKELCEEYQGLRELRETGYALDMGMLVDFLGRLNPRRTMLGYSFRQFDEREWGYRFDDILSDEDEDDGNETQGDGWDYYDEAMDTATPMLAKPASEEVVKNLPRSTYGDIQNTTKAPETKCQICQEDFGKDTVVAHLPCEHFFCTECIPLWLKQSASCPTCRHRLPTKKDGNDGKAVGREGDEMDCDDEDQENGPSEEDGGNEDDVSKDDVDMASDEEEEEEL